jgi:hypothetical protein
MFNAEPPSQSELPTTDRLIRSTLLAFIGACVLLVLFVLPAEYGIDPTGIGGKIGLTQMAHAGGNTGNQSLEIVSTPTGDWRDEVSVTIDGYGQLELKLSMQQGETATYEWETTGGTLDSDMHGDGASDKFISYREAKSEKQNHGNLTAGFDGTHGWYWQNKGRKKVTVTLRTRGTYSDIKRVL